MAKKITLAMVKRNYVPSDEELTEIFGFMMDNVKGMKDISEKDFTPLTIEEDSDMMAGIAFAVMALVKKTCTPAAWKYIVNDLRDWKTEEA